MNRCTYPVPIRRGRLGRWLGRPTRRPCGKPAVWHVMIWGRVPFTRPPDWSALRCQGHRCHDIQERILADHIREVML